MPNSDSQLLPESIGKRVDPTYSKTLQTRLKELLHIQNESFPGSQPVSFESKHLTDIEREDYFVCEKSDGVRYLLFFLHSSKGPASFLYDRNKYWYYVPNLLFPVRGRENEYLKDTVMDGELVLDIDQHKKTWRYLIFDLMVVNGSTIVQRSFSTRLGMLQQDVIQPFNARMRTVQNDPSALPPFTVELKKMERSYGLHLVFEQIPKLKHKSDGIIWTPVKYPYTTGTCEKLLKWKPPELNTVDFRIAARWSKEHKPIYSVEVLSNGVTYKFYDHFQPEPALATQWKNQLPDGRIAEFRYDSDCEVTIVEQGYAPTLRKGGWRFVRFRDDKNTANDEQVVKKIMNSIQDGVTKEQLLLCMDRVRAAWKAREKGLPMPPPPPTPKTTNELSLSTTTLPPTTPALTTPSSASPTLNSPSINTSSGYFRDNVTRDGQYDSNTNSRNNSISSEGNASNGKRKSSVSSINNTPVKEDVPVDEVTERKRLKAVEEEEAETLQKPLVSKQDGPKSAPPAIQQVNMTQSPVVAPTPIAKTASPPARRRKISTASVPVLKKEADPPPAPKIRKATQPSPGKRIVSAPAILPVKQEVLLPSPQSLPLPPPSLPLSASPTSLPISHQQQQIPSAVPEAMDYRTSRKTKPIPQLPKETTTKKLKPSSSSNINNLLTTSLEPTPLTSTTSPGGRAYNFSTILQRKEVSAPSKQMKTSPHLHQQPLQIQQQQNQLQALHHQQQQQQQQQHMLQQQPQGGPVQFINFHAEGRQNSPQMNNNHVMIIRSESNTQTPSIQQQQQQQQQQKSPSSRVWKSNVKQHERTPPLKAQQPYSPYSNNSSYHSVSHYPRQEPFYDSNKHYGIPAPAPQQLPMYSQPPSQPPPPPPNQPSSSFGFRRNEQQAAHDYQMLQQQQRQVQQQLHDNQKRKNSQKAKLDFILN